MLSELERRSLIKQFLVIIEDGLKANLTAMVRSQETDSAPACR